MFGLSGSKNKSRTTGRSSSQSSSFNNADSFQGSVGGSVSGGVSRGGSQSGAVSRDSVAFEDVFARLFGGAENAASSLDPSMLTTAANQLFSAGTDFISNIGGDAGSSFLTERLSERSDLESAQLDQLRGDIGELFNEELLPGITSEAVAGGQLGGGRQGVAQGEAIEAAADAFTRGAIDIRTQNRQELDAIATGIADRTVTGAQVGTGALPGVASIAEMGFGANLRGAQLLSAILGDPTVLGSSASQASSFNTAEDFARAFSESFGASTARGGSQSSSVSRTDSRSKGGSIGIGFGDN